MCAFRKLSIGFVSGLIASPFFGAAVALCDSPLTSSSPSLPFTGSLASLLASTTPGENTAKHISADRQTNHLFDDDPLPTAEELEYIKTWGVKWVDDWDQPGKRGIAAQRRSVKRQILLIRHGQYENEHSRDDSIRFLTPLGEAQAIATGKYLSEMFKQSEERLERVAAHDQAADVLKKAIKSGDAAEAELDVLRNKLKNTDIQWRLQGGPFVATVPQFVHVSDMTRAKQTANLILDAFPDNVKKHLAVDAGLRERYPCLTQPSRGHAPASADDVKGAEDMFEKYFHRPTSSESTVEIIVGHSNMIRYWTLRALQMPPEGWLRLSLPHCSITSITINGAGEVSVSGLGSYGHLLPEQVTTHNLK